MIIEYNDPVCECGSLCAQPTSQTAQLTPDSRAIVTNAIVQDTTSPTSFFRLISETRDKIYFLSCRPDCHYSFGEKEGCDKRHVHNSAKGRKSAWKWLVLCRQTWSEASQYMPIIRNNIRFYINDDNCVRCWYGRNRRLKEGMLHASLKQSLSERCGLREIWYTRLRKLTIEFEKYDNIYGEADHKLDRFAHNFDSLIAFVGKLRSLKRISINVKPDFTALLSNTGVSDRMTRVFSILKARIDDGLLEINILQNAYEISAPTSDPILQLAALAGLSNKNINLTTIKIERPSIGHVFDSKPFCYNSWYEEEKRWEARLGSQLLYQTRLFDEDFEGIPAPEKLVWEDFETPSEVPGEPPEKGKRLRGGLGLNQGQPTYYLRSGCMLTDFGKYKYLKDFLPLYLQEDFYHRSESATEEYRPIPECLGCGIVLSDFEQLTAHIGQCAGRDDTMTPVPSAWGD